MIVAFQGRPQPTLTINDGSLAGCDSIPDHQVSKNRGPDRPLSPLFEFLFQPCPWVIYADPHCLNIFKPSQTRQRDKMGQAMVNPCQSNYLDQNWTYRFHPYTASSLHTQAIYRFQGQHDRPFSRASTCFRWEGVDNWWVNCEFMCYLAVPVAFALLLGEMDTQYLSKIWTKAYHGLYIYIYQLSYIIYIVLK